MSSRVLFCGCPHPFQDSVYGKNNRLHTISFKGDDAYCTACGTRRSNPSAASTKKKGQAKK